MAICDALIAAKEGTDPKPHYASAARHYRAFSGRLFDLARHYHEPDYRGKEGANDRVYTALEKAADERVKSLEELAVPE
jgi:hypothetical protein